VIATRKGLTPETIHKFLQLYPGRTPAAVVTKASRLISGQNNY
jgi:hypothetical protein